MIPNGTETRRRAGITEILVHRVNGESAWQSAYDARQAVRNHSDEWAFTPWPADDVKKAQVDMPADPDHIRRGESGFAPVY